jgi:tetratricopeptide (TPR) repeat protein
MRLAFVMMMALLLAPGAALAQRARSAKELIKEAARLYDAREYEESVKLLLQAYDMDPNPRLLYNIARAYDQAGNANAAIEYYLKYLGTADEGAPEVRKRARLSVERLQLQQRKEEEASRAAETERKRLQEEAEAARRRAEEEAEMARRAEETNQLRRKADHENAVASYRRSQVLSFALGGVAVAGAGTGIFFGVQANAAREGLKSATTLEGKQTAVSDTRGKALVADIGFGVGLASAVTAILLYPKGPPPTQEGEARLTVAPRGLGAGLEVSF